MATHETNIESLRPARILVVDDELMMRELLLRWLTDAGYQCELATNAYEALELCGQSMFDLIISDIRMPGKSGLELLVEMQTQDLEQAFIFLTGSDDPSFPIKAVNSRSWGYLLKPIEREELIEFVHRTLAKFRTIAVSRRYTSMLEEQICEKSEQLRLSHEEAIHRLVVASMVRDDETGAHIRRIGLFSAAAMQVAGWSAAEADNMRLAAPMHDIGKIGIPDAILLKPGKLTEAEFNIMKSHTLIGASILTNSESPMIQLAESIARSHHERWDGTGYPDKLRGEEIPIAARIVAIVDVYDALIHDRIYRAAMPESKALEILHEGRATHFDPELLEVFFEALPVIREIEAQHGEQERALKRPAADCKHAPAFANYATSTHCTSLVHPISDLSWINALRVG